MKTFAERLKELRKGRKLTQQQAADLFEIPQKNYAAYEEDRAKPPLELADRMCDVFGVTLKQLIGTEHHNPEKTFKARYSTAPPNVRKAIDLLLNVPD